MSIFIPQSALESIQQHAKASYPNEACGFFFGQDGETRVVSHVLAVQNQWSGDKRKNFEIAPQDYMKAERLALEEKLDLLGVYHSHPDHPARPSETDLKKAMPWFSYIITSVSGENIWETTSWRLNGEGVFINENIIREISLASPDKSNL